MDDEVPRLSLKWNHFKENFTSQFEYLKEEEEFVDVTLSCQGRLLRAHKVVLSASSPYLTSLFKENPCKHPVVILDMPVAHVEALLAFIYTGAVSVLEAELPAFLESANTLQIRGLSDHIPVKNNGSPTPMESLPRKRPGVDSGEAPVPSKRFYARLDGQRRHSKPASQEFETLLQVKKEEINFTDVEIEPEFEVKKEEKGHVEEQTQSSAMDTPTSDTLQTSPMHRRSLEDHDNTNLDATSSSLDGRRRHSLDPRPCPICNRLYSNVSNLRQHLRLIHNPTIVTCKLCSKTFKTDLYMRRHLISYHGENLTPEPASWRAPPAFSELFPALQVNPVTQ